MEEKKRAKRDCKYLEWDDSNIEEGCRMCLLTGNSCTGYFNEYCSTYEKNADR